ncbi:MAG TPA: tetratricopeptide repeat protein [Candidatus Aquabacterium excrementipullorum]|nr:tetratricopeptide repeat protein [Candidatus Aquabacterium excrementipullorum]
MQSPASSEQAGGPTSLPPVDAEVVDALIDQAVAALDQGHTQQARAGLERALALDARQFDAWHLLGVIALQARDFARAIELIEQANAIDPDVAMAHVNLGVASMESGLHEKAEQAFLRAVTLDPQEPGAFLGHGAALMALKRWEGAADSLGKALEQQPGNAEAQFNRGNAFLELKRFEAAVDSYDKVLAVHANHVGALINRAHACLALKRYEEAIQNCQKANALQPDRASAYTVLGETCMAMGGYAEALASYDRALALQPGQFVPLANRGSALLKLGRATEAIHSFEQALAIEPQHATVISNLAGALREAERWDDAWAFCQKALQIEPLHAGAHMNRGNVLLDRGELPAAREAFATVVSLQPDDADAQWSLGWCDLLLGDWTRGLPQLEWRWRKPGFTSPVRNFSKPLWLGQDDLRGRTILLHAEQGLGDTVQFCRYASQLSAMGARVLLEVQPPLKQLMGSLAGVAQVVVKGEGFLPPFDVHCPLMSLPQAFGAHPAMAPAGAYLHADRALAEAWAERLGPRVSPRVGLVWSGNMAHRNDRLRSLSAAALLQAMPPGIQLYSLQKDIRATDRPALQAHGVADFSAELRDFADTAALVEQMDLVVSVDTSVAHLAAAMGKPTWILLTKMPDWRWLMARPDTPWYASARLFRQGHWGRWDDVLAQVGQALHKELAKPPSSALQ